MSDEQDSKPAPPAAPPVPPTPAPAAPAAAAAPPKADPLKQKIESRAVDILTAEFASEVVEIQYHAGQAIARVRKGRFLDLMRTLRDHADLKMDHLSNLTAVHWPKREPPFEMVYHVFSISRRHRLTVKVDLAEGEEMPTACGLWPTANWHEREVFDLFGIRFTGHPDMTRILMTDEWVGHPLRKDYPLEGKAEDHVQYREVATAEHVYRYDKAPLRGFGWKKEVEKTGVGNG